MPSCKAVWTDGTRFLHTSGTGHALVSDAPPSAGGDDTAPTPMELVLHALCGCMGIDLAGMLSKMRQRWTGMQITAEGVRADEHPRIYKTIDLHVKVTGPVEEDKLQRAIALSLDTYCSVAGILRATAEIIPTWEIKP